MGLPLVELDSVFHIGTLDPADKGRFYAKSYEGHGLSVSPSLEACESWERIARLGGHPWWRLDKEGGRFVDAHALTKAQRRAITDWGVEQGLVERVTTWRVVWYDDETEQECYFSFESREEADFEAAERGEVKQAQSLKGKPKLDALVGQEVGLECFDLLLVAYAERELEVDGVIWFDVDDGWYSAPRGVVLPGKVNEWEAVKISVPRPSLGGLSSHLNPSPPSAALGEATLGLE